LTHFADNVDAIKLEYQKWLFMAWNGISNGLSLFPQYFQFWHFSVKLLFSVSHIMQVWGSMSNSMHREVKIKHDLMTHKCKNTLMA